jgi:hypothetical protein
MVLLFVYVRTDMRADALLIGALAAVLAGRCEWPVAVIHAGPPVPVGGLGCDRCPGMVGPFPRVEKPLLYLGGFTVVAVACGVLALAVLPNSGWPAPVPCTGGHWAALGIVSYGA